MAAAAGREHPRLGEAEEGVGREQQVHPADQRRRDPAGAQRLAGPVQGDERGGTGGVDGLGRAAQVEDVADPVGQDRQRAAGHEVAVARGDVGPPEVAVVGQRPADEDAGGAAGQGAGRQAGILQRLGRHFQQQALLRVHLHRLARGDAEGAGVEAGDIAERAGGEAVGLARLAAARMGEIGLREAVRRHGGDGIPAFGQQAPIGIEVGGAGEPAGGPDDGDRPLRPPPGAAAHRLRHAGVAPTGVARTCAGRTARVARAAAGSGSGGAGLARGRRSPGRASRPPRRNARPSPGCASRAAGRAARRGAGCPASA